MYVCIGDVFNAGCFVVQMEALQLYRRYQKLRDRGKIDPNTGRVYAKLGMAQFCRQVEDTYNLRPGSIAHATLNRWQRKGIVSADTVRVGRSPVLPVELEDRKLLD